MALLHVNFYSRTLERETQMDVILPEAAKKLIGMEGVATRQCKTLYLLHGMSDDHTIWQRRTSIERYAADYGIAVVMPSTQLGWYTDMHIGFPWFTYITQELPAICRSFFPNMSEKREDTFVAGLSMGGYGALKCALRAPETYCAAASLSGAVDVSALTLEKPAGERGYWEDVFGPAQAIAGSENDLFAVSDRLAASGKALPKLYMWCGTEDGLYGQNVRLRDHLRAKGYDLTYEESPGDHQWKYWDEKIQTVLSWLPISKPAKN